MKASYCSSETGSGMSSFKRDLLQECLAKSWESADVDSVILQRERLIHYIAKNRSPC